MEWIEAVVHTTTVGSDLVSDILIRCGAAGTQVEDRADVATVNREKIAWELFDENMVLKMPEDVLVRGWFSQEDPQDIAAVREQLVYLRQQAADIDLGTLRLEMNNAADEDWAENWKKYYKPFRIGSHLVVKPTWEPYQAKADDVIIELDPGMAFGTGTHETTNMCMMLLEKHMNAGMRVMDVGTGSGILAIAAAKLGAKAVLAVDIDPDAVKVATENIERNQVKGQVRAVQGDLVKSEAMTCDLAVANIIADAICALAAPLRRHLVSGGPLICSGIIREREQDVLDALQAAGYTVADRLTQGEWVALCAKGEK